MNRFLFLLPYIIAFVCCMMMELFLNHPSLFRTNPRIYLAPGDTLRSIQAAAERGDPEAQYKLGRIYKDGDLGVSSSDFKARDWLQASAAQGNVEAQNELSDAKRNSIIGTILHITITVGAGAKIWQERERFRDDPALRGKVIRLYIILNLILLRHMLLPM